MAEEVTAPLERGRDYWALRIARDSAATVLFLIFPLVQVAKTRGITLAVGVTIICLVLGHIASGGRGVAVAIGEVWRSVSEQARGVILGAAAAWLWFALSLAWSPDPAKGASILAILAIIPFVAWWLVADLSRTVLMRPGILVPLGLVAGSALVISDMAGATRFYAALDPRAFPYDLNRNAIMLFLFWLAWWSGPRQVLHWAVGALVLAAVFLSESQAAQLAALVGLATLAFLHLVPRAVMVVWGGMAVAVLAAPLVFPNVAPLIEQAPASIQKAGHMEHRAAIWRGYGDLIAERPITGHGFAAARALGLAEKAGGPSDAIGYPEKITSPHSMGLSLWTDGGAVAAILFAALLALAGRFAATIHRGRVFTALIAAGFAHAMVATSAWQGWWLATLAVAVVIFALVRERRST